jgi:hypothetical protein
MGQDLECSAIRQLIFARGHDWLGPIAIGGRAQINPASSEQDGACAQRQAKPQAHGGFPVTAQHDWMCLGRD